MAAHDAAEDALAGALAGRRGSFGCLAIAIVITAALGAGTELGLRNGNRALELVCGIVGSIAFLGLAVLVLGHLVNALCGYPAIRAARKALASAAANLHRCRLRETANSAKWTEAFGSIHAQAERAKAAYSSARSELERLETLLAQRQVSLHKVSVREGIRVDVRC